MCSLVAYSSSRLINSHHAARTQIVVVDSTEYLFGQIGRYLSVAGGTPFSDTAHHGRKYLIYCVPQFMKWINVAPGVFLVDSSKLEVRVQFATALQHGPGP